MADREVRQNLREMRLCLEQYVASRLPRLEAKDMAGSHLLGIATHSIRSLEVLMRDLLAYYLSACDFEYARDIRAPLKFSKDLRELTLGQVINCFRTLNPELSRRWVRVTKLKTLAGDLFPKSLDEKLAKVTTTRRSLQHYNVPALRDAIRELLLTIREVLAKPMFNV